MYAKSSRHSASCIAADGVRSDVTYLGSCGRVLRHGGGKSSSVGSRCRAKVSFLGSMPGSSSTMPLSSGKVKIVGAAAELPLDGGSGCGECRDQFTYTAGHHLISRMVGNADGGKFDVRPC